MWHGNRLHISALLVLPLQKELQELINTGQGQKKLSVTYLKSLHEKTISKKSVSFKVFLEPQEKVIDKVYFHNSDVLFGFGRDASKRRESITKFNFILHDKIWLKIGEVKVKPTLCHLERNFGLDNGRNIWITFNFDKKEISMLQKKKRLELYFENPLPREGVAIFKWPVNLLI